MKKIFFSQRLAALGDKALCVLVLLLFAGLALLNLVWTAGFSYSSDTYILREMVLFGRNPVMLFVLNFAAALALTVLLRPLLYRIPQRLLMAALLILTVAVSFGWSLYCGAVPRADGEVISGFACQFLLGNFSALNTVGGYLYIHPHQLGFTAYTELLYRIGGAGNYRLFYFVNALAMAWCFYELCRLGDMLRGARQGEQPGRGTAFLLFGAWSAMMYCVFFYGNVIGMALGTAALRRELLWLENGRTRHLASTVVFITMAVLVKMFSMLYLIAMIILLVLEALRNRRLKPLAVGVLLVVCWLAGSRLLFWGYEQRSGMQIPAGQPMILFPVMGMHDSSRGPGWYDGYETLEYLASNCDGEAATRAAMKSIAERMEWFAENPGKCGDFYLQKTISQWAEPTHQCLWLTYKLQDAGRSALLQRFFTGLAGDIAVAWMTWYHILVFATAAYYVASRHRRLMARQLLPALVIMGGFFFQLLWEAKSQYTLCYFLLAIPYAAAGLSDLTERLERYFHRLKA